MIKHLILLDLHDEDALAHLKSLHPKGRPVMVLSAPGLRSVAEDAAMLLDAVHPGATELRMTLGEIAARITDSRVQRMEDLIAVAELYDPRDPEPLCDCASDRHS